jgi:uncharacterized membrane protein
MTVLLMVLQWLHVFCGIFWFGSSLYAYFILFPAVAALSPEKQAELTAPIGERTGKVIGGVASGAIVLGILRGTVFGPVRSLDFLFGSAYGLTWLVSLVLGIGLATFGATVLGPLATGVGSDVSVAVRAANSAKLRRLASVELLGFLAIFTCMILMRFGY